MLLTNHQLESSDALRTLVALGPDSLPFLLNSLADKTPTKLEMHHEGCFGGMSLSNELWGNPVNPIEAVVLATRRNRGGWRGRLEKSIHHYTVKVGDICLVAIGQITGRGYEAVRYQPTACIVVNSPTEDAEYRREIRYIWSSKDPAKRLFDSLLLDYATEGKWKECESFDRWGVGSNLQVEAVMRLLYYFPKETAAMIARRLQRLGVEKVGPGKGTRATDEEMDAWMHREAANGARTVELVKAVAWCEEPAIRDAVRSIVQRTDDPEIRSAVSLGIGKSYVTLIPLTNSLDSDARAPGWSWRTWLACFGWIAFVLVFFVPCVWYCLRRVVQRRGIGG
jgi:hypothetical protein